jgi:hypothetical protein
VSTRGATKVTMPFEQRIPQFVHQHRNSLGPPALGLLLLAVTAAAHATSLWPWADLRWFGVLVAGVYLVLGLDGAQALPGKLECRTAAAGWVFGAGWMAAGSWWGPWSPLMLSLLGAGVVGLGIPWAWHRRVRRGVEVDREIPAWGDGNAVGLKGTEARGTKAGADWFSFRVKAHETGRYVLDDYRARRKRIAARFGVRSEAVSFRELDAEGEVEVTIRQGARQTVAYEATTDAVPIGGPHRIGTCDDGEPLLVAMYLSGGDGGRAGAQHAGITGDSGTGKSSLVNRTAAVVVRAPDALLWMIDLSLGAQELKAWAPACDWFATSPEEAERMIAAATAVAEDRGRRARSRLFAPSAGEPLIVILADEMASVFAPDLLADAEHQDRMAAKREAGARADRFEEGVRNYRKHGVAFWGATQYGDGSAFASPAAKQQLISGHAAVFYAAKNTTGHLVIPASHGVKSSELPPNKPGTLFIRSVVMDGVRKGRVEYMDDDEVADTVAAWAGRQPTLESRAVAAAGVTYRDRQRTAPGDDGQVPPRPRPRVVAEETPKRMPSAEESRQLVLDALAEFPEGAGPKAVADVCGKSPETVKNRLAELLESDPPRVRRVRPGKWAVITVPEQR